MDDSLKKAREARDKPKKQKKVRTLPEGFVRMKPDDLLNMVNQALSDNEEFRKSISSI